MSDRKNIERLFQEKFKDFEVNPPEEIWNTIEEKLEKKKRRRVIPFWWKLSGVAALFIVGFFISKSINDKEINTENPVVIENKSNIENGIASPDLKKNELKENNTIITGNDVVNNSPENKNNSEQKSNKITTSKTTIFNNKSSKDYSLKNKKVETKTVLENFEDQIVVNSEKETKSSSEKSIVQVENNSKTINLDELKNKNSIIASTEIEKKANDSVTNNSVVTNALEELLNEKESKTKQESKINRWQLTSNVAPIFLGSISSGSPLDAELDNNSKSYNTSVAYGLGVNYAVTPRLSVRTGLNKLNMSYNTNDIVFYAGLEAKTLKTVSRTASSAMIQVQSNSPSNNPSISSSENVMLPFENSFVNQTKGYLNQEIGYLEMPMEMAYAIVDKKFGLKIIGGFSTLFLQDNSITIVSDAGNMLLGETNNLNNIHFSTNLGLGLKYGFMKSFEFNVEPTVKYQLDTYNSTASDFNPYVFGIYSGVSYKF